MNAKVKISQLAAEVAALLGESLALSCHPAESPFPDLALRVRLRAPGELAQLLLSADPAISGAVKEFGSRLSIDAEGVVELELPPDFLKLAAVKMSDWKREVNSITTPESGIGLMQSSKWKGVRGTPEKPVAMTAYNKSGAIVLKLFASNAKASLDYALYFPVPSVDADDCLEVPPALYGDLINRLAVFINNESYVSEPKK